MQTFISLLRGINVSGQKSIKMDALRTLYENLGFTNVTSYLQSGNVVFKANNAETGKLEQAISKQIKTDFGFDVPVMVLTQSCLQKVVENNPFLNNPDFDHAFLHVTFLASNPDNYDVKAIESKTQNEETIRFFEHAVYLYCPNGYGKTKLTNNFLEAKLKVVATTRNWKTTKELLKIAQ